MRVQVSNKDDVGVGASIDGSIVVIVLGDNYPLDSGEMLFQVMSIGLLLLPIKGGGMLTRTGLIHGLAHSSHDSEESLLLSRHGSHDGLSHGRILLLPLSGGGGLLLLGREVGGDACHGQQDRGSWGGGGQQRTLGLGQR
jgi:hypothetical protein